MTDAPAAIKATFSDFRLIKGRKVAQLVCEIPIEEADAALTALGGLPQPAAERWVALARLNAEKPSKPVLSGKDIWRASAECAMLCKEPRFWDFLYKTGHSEYPIVHEDMAIMIVRNICEITSRADLDKNSDAAIVWRELKIDYDKWKEQHS